MVCGQTCDGLYHFAFYLVNFGIPLGSQPIKSARALLHGPLSRVHFWESLVVRLYSEIDQIHLSSEAQCVSHHLPQVDCHNFQGLPAEHPCKDVFLKLEIASSYPHMKCVFYIFFPCLFLSIECLTQCARSQPTSPMFSQDKWFLSPLAFCIKLHLKA